MTREEAEKRARAIFDHWAKQGIMPFEDTYSMNPEDIEAITGPIADAIQNAWWDAKDHTTRVYVPRVK